MQRMSLWKKSSNACLEILETSSLKNYSLLKNSLGISLWHARIPILHDERQENFMLLFTFLFEKAKIILEIQLPLMHLASFGNIFVAVILTATLLFVGHA